VYIHIYIYIYMHKYINLYIFIYVYVNNAKRTCETPDAPCSGTFVRVYIYTHTNITNTHVYIYDLARDETQVCSSGS